MSRRRLSRGGRKANLPLQEEEQTIEDDMMSVQSSSRRNSFASRRRLSLGKSSSPEETEEMIQDQNRIAEMYKTIIKMSSENKINAKNSWNLDLINHMDKMIKSDESTQRNGINFQKASCTLDASIKIYSHRVDDTWSSSYRILENLSRNEHVDEDSAHEDDDDDDSENGPKRQKKTSKVGSKSSLKRHNLTSTIEKKIDSLNLSIQDNSHTADPMFHKMSQAFDEGGAKGMLMANLRVSHDSSSIMFSAEGQQKEASQKQENECQDSSNQDSSGEANKKEITAITNESTIVSGSNQLLIQSGFKMDELAAKLSQSSLKQYRDVLKIYPVESFNMREIAPLHIIDSASAGLVNEHQNFNNNDTVDQCDDFGDVGCDYCDDDDDDEENGFEGSQLTAEAVALLPGNGSDRRTSASSDEMSVYSSSSKIQWGAVYEDESTGENSFEQETSTEKLSVNDTSPLGFQTSKQNAASAAAFLALHSGANNQWAGAKHWRRGTRQRIPTAEKPSTSSNALAEKKTARSRAKKEKFRFDFSNVGEGVSSQISSKFEKEKGSRKLDPTLLSKAVLQKAELQADEGNLVLPPDARLNTKDLCRLFHWSSMIVPPSNTSQKLRDIICSPSPVSHRYAGAVSDLVLREQKSGDSTSGADKIWSGGSGTSNNNEDDEDNAAYCDDDQPFYDNDDDDENDEPVSTGAPQGDHSGGISSLPGLSCEVEGGLLQAPRKVEKIDIGYAKASKRVNVKKLKTDLWSKLQNDCSDEAIENNYNSDATDQKALSFQHVVSDIAAHQSQKDASLSFYFICLLHLANEKNLSITDNPNMDDLMISKGTQ